jgi:hypothetical protein
LNWPQVRLANGCHLDWNVKALVAAQPFASVEVEEFYPERTPRTHGCLFRGTAVKRSDSSRLHFLFTGFITGFLTGIELKPAFAAWKIDKVKEPRIVHNFK